MSLKEKLENIRDNEEENNVDWIDRKNQWVNSVNSLFHIIKNDWLSHLIDENLLKIKTSSFSTSEEYIGSYNINKMEITYSTTSCIALEPIGRNIIGGEGRIDLYKKGEVSKGLMLILFRENGEDNWYVISQTSRDERELLSKSSFENIIEKLI